MRWLNTVAPHRTKKRSCDLSSIHNTARRLKLNHRIPWPQPRIYVSPAKHAAATPREIRFGLPPNCSNFWSVKLNLSRRGFGRVERSPAFARQDEITRYTPRQINLPSSLSSPLRDSLLLKNAGNENAPRPRDNRRVERKKRRGKERDNYMARGRGGGKMTLVNAKNFAPRRGRE